VIDPERVGRVPVRVRAVHPQKTCPSIQTRQLGIVILTHSKQCSIFSHAYQHHIRRCLKRSTRLKHPVPQSQSQ
jgi:hypothetical protein